jgi:UDP-N-acetylmuramate-alanine ligase
VIEAKGELMPMLVTNLPGLYNVYNITAAIAVARAWGVENGGKPMTETLWSFRDPGKRDWFILRWT